MRKSNTCNCISGFLYDIANICSLKMLHYMVAFKLQDFEDFEFVFDRRAGQTHVLIYQDYGIKYGRKVKYAN